MKAGVGRTVIALWPGYESIETTQVYLESILAMNETALAKTTIATKHNASELLEACRVGALVSGLSR
jgi:hypothetical protein